MIQKLELECIDGSREINDLMGSFGDGSCEKIAILWKGKRYIVKLPDNFADFIALFPEKEFSRYSTDPACEWLGSQIFGSLGIPVQNVELCKYRGKIVAACENFVQPHEILSNFKNIYNDWSQGLVEPIVQQLTGQEAIGIEDISRIIADRYPNSGIEDFFWSMFVVDALIGNNDRNAGNWGVLLNNDLSLSRIAPVYDNGSSFSKGWSDVYISKMMKNPAHSREMVCNLNIPFVHNGDIISHNSYLNGNPDRDCVDAIMRIVPEMDINLYCNAIDQLAVSGILSSVKADFYKQSLEWRYDDILRPALRQAEYLRQGGPS